MSVAIEVTLDVKQSGVQKTVTGFYVGENGEKYIVVNFTKGSSVYRLPNGCTAVVYTEKPDGTRGMYTCSTGADYVYFTPHSQILTVEGNVRCQIELIGANDTKLYSPEFVISVAQGIESGAESSDEYETLETLIAGANAVIENTHTHSNKSVLDTVTSDVVSHEHTHSNKSVLDTVTPDVVSHEHTHSNKSVLDTVTSDVVSHEHTHSNKSVLDTVTSDVVSHEHTHSNKSALDALNQQNGYLYSGENMVNAVQRVENDNLPQNAPNGMLAVVLGTEDRLKIKQSNGWYFVGHTHSNKSVLDTVTSDVVSHEHTHSNKSVLDTVTSDVVANSHTHINATQIAKFSEDANGNATYNNEVLATQDVLDDAVSDLETAIAAHYPPDTLVPLALGTEYASLSVRDDWQDVPVYNLGDNPVVCRLASDDTVGAFAASEIRLMYLTDYITGMPVPTLRVTTGGDWYICYADTFHDLGQTYAAGWYDANGTRMNSAPTLTNMTFDSLVIGTDDPITDLSDLSGEALAALKTLSRMVNVSTDAMGMLGVVENGVQRLTHAPQTSGQHYAFTTDRDITFPLPEIEWTGRECEFWLDLDCTSSVNLTFSDTVCYEDGGNIDTTLGIHRLHFYVPADADTWTVAETESYTEITEDYLPEYTIPFRNCTADQIRAVLKLGHSDGNGNWCVRRKDGIIQTWFSIGDTRSVTLTDGREVTMRIIGIQHDDLPNGGKAALTCDITPLLTVDTYAKNISSPYDTSLLRTRAKNIENLFPTWLKGLICPAHKKVNLDVYGNYTYVDDRVWVPSCAELMNDSTDWGIPDPYVSDGEKYPIYTDNSSRIMNDNSGDRAEYFTRTCSGQLDWRGIGTNGRMFYVSQGSSTYTTIHVAFCLDA